MKSRWLSRGLVVSVAFVSSIGAAACSRAPADTGDAAPAPAAAQAESPTKHTPGYRLFRQIEGLDLTGDQRDDLREIEGNLAADLSAHREVLRQVAETLARGLETGALDPQEAARSQAAMKEAAGDVKAAVTTAMNEVHDVLDADQREALVQQLKERRLDARGPEGAEGRRPGLGKLAEKLGLDREQEQAIRDEVRDYVEEAFPERKARREAWEAKMQALSDAFVSDDFDAADFELGEGSDEAIGRFTATASKALEISGRVLAPPQRKLAATLLRSRAAEL